MRRIFKFIGTVFGLATAVIGASTLSEDLGEWVKILGRVRMEIAPYITHDLGRWLVVSLGVFIVLVFKFGPMIRKIFNHHGAVENQGKDKPNENVILAEPSKYTEQDLENMRLGGVGRIRKRILGTGQRIYLMPTDEDDEQDKPNWSETIDGLIQEAVQLKHRAGQAQWYHYHHQEWRDDYYSWLKKLLSAVNEQYGSERRDYVKGYIADKAIPSDWKPFGAVQNFIVKDVWKLEGELEWLRGERENLKTSRQSVNYEPPDQS